MILTAMVTFAYSSIDEFRDDSPKAKVKNSRDQANSPRGHHNEKSKMSDTKNDSEGFYGNHDLSTNNRGT